MSFDMSFKRTGSRAGRRITTIAVGLTAAALALTACGSGTAADSTTTVRVGVYAGNTLIDLTTFVAIEQGILAEQLAEVDADYEIVEFGSGPDLIAAMLGGSADVGVLPGGAVTAVNAQAGQPAVRLLTNSFEGTGLVFVGAEQYEATDGDDLAAFDGRVWGYSKEGSASQILAQFVVDRDFSGWANQTGLALGPTSTTVPALSRDQVDIIVTDPAGAAVAVADGAGYVVHNPAESDEYFPYTRICNGVTASSAFVQEHPEVAQAIVDSQVEAIALLKGSADAAAAIGLTPQAFQDANGASFDVAWDLFLPSLGSTDGTISSECVDDTVAYSEYQGISDVDTSAFAALD